MPASRTSQCDIRPSDAIRFNARLSPTDTSCVRWIGRYRTIKGFTYPIFDTRLGCKMARTMAWIFGGKGDPPKGGLEMVCGNNWCVNPEHMRVIVRREAK